MQGIQDAKEQVTKGVEADRGTDRPAIYDPLNRAFHEGFIQGVDQFTGDVKTIADDYVKNKQMSYKEYYLFMGVVQTAAKRNGIHKEFRTNSDLQNVINDALVGE